MEFNYVPQVGANPLTFGLSPDKASEILGRSPTSTHKGFIEGNFSQFYRKPFIKLTFSEKSGLHTIEIVPEPEVTVNINGKVLISGEGYAVDIVDFLTRLNGEPERGLGILKFKNLGISIPMDLDSPNYSLAMSNFTYVA